VKTPRGGLCAILIQKQQTTENIDSRNCLLGVKNCTLIVGHRLFQQHRPTAVIDDQQSWNAIYEISQKRPSIHRHTARLDRVGPFLDFALDEPGKILRHRTLVGSYRGAEFQDAHADRGRVQCLYDRVVERLHDSVRGASGQKERGPGVVLQSYPAPAPRRRRVHVGLRPDRT
jgi:hypothetical protein